MASQSDKSASKKFSFRPRARLLLLLGDQLIRDPNIAVFELVKNAYDADSSDVKVTMSLFPDSNKNEIVIEDSGLGMDFETVTGIWLEPGTDYRVRQREAGELTPKGRMPLGEKGVGRFAAHKLGHKVTLITRKAKRQEVLVEIDWEADFEGKKYLADVPVTVTTRKPHHFKGTKTGTRIEIKNLRNEWDRGMVRNLARSINSIASPFRGKGDFHPKLILTTHKEWLKDLLDVRRLLKYSLFQAHCDLKASRLSYEYQFTPYPAMQRVEPRSASHSDINITRRNKESRKSEIIDLEKHHVGPIHLDLYIFDREPNILALSEVADIKGLKQFLDESGGVRVYRDGIRVYDYAEQDNDWLNLDARRVNVPTARISNNLIAGAVSLSLKDSVDLKEERGLIEKTNREGFVDNPDFRAFRDAVIFAITHVQAERNKDKAHLRNLYSGEIAKEPVLADLTELRALVEKKKLSEEMGPFLDRIERDFMVIRERFLTSASAGLNLSIVIHEVEKGVQSLKDEVRRGRVTPQIKSLAIHLSELVEGFGALLRGSGVSRVKASTMISQAVFNTELRLKVHDITPNIDLKKNDFETKCSRRLIVSTLMNLIDNSIWWLDNKWGKVAKKKHLYVGMTREFSGAPAIVVADNGPGFIDPPEYLIEPFITRKPDGMGLGLHLADQVMKAQGGKLVFPERGDLKLPKELDGAVVALVFGKSRKSGSH
jgi:anti-sigma regulatory factor (Ser/Thr protein kinase)